MKQALTAITLLIFASSPMASVYACGFHGGYDTPSPYGWTLQTYDDAEYETAPVEKKKPVFSTVATRASDLAKAKVQNDDAEKQNLETQDKAEDSVETVTEKTEESRASL